MPELTGKLDTSVNGPEGLPPFDGDAWDHVDWRQHEEQVQRLRGRIFKAVQEGDWPLARNVQKLMLRSWSNTLPIERAAGDAAQHGPQDCGNRRAGRADQPGTGRDGGAGARQHRLASAVPGPAGVYTESQ